jgi:UDP-3-O-[3-hydroxymyristoyl] glucosamine N-acyltransferase
MRRLDNPVLLGGLVGKFGGRLASQDYQSKAIYRISSLSLALSDDISFVAQSKYVEAALMSKAGVLIISPDHEQALSSSSARLWVVENPYATYAKVSALFADALFASAQPEVHPSAIVSDQASVHRSATIGPNVVVEAGASIGARVRLSANVVVGQNTSIGADTLIYPNVVLYHGCAIGERNIIHAGTVIGSDGFGFAKEHGQWIKIAQLGAVVIGDDVEIGSNCSIDRGAIEDTIIGNSVKIDNLVQIAHNVQIGAGTAIAGCVGIAGSAIIGKNCAFGGSAGVLGHLEICDNVTVSSMSLVTKSIKKPGFYSGVFPLQDNADWERVAVSLKQLPLLRQRLRELERLSK